MDTRRVSPGVLFSLAVVPAAVLLFSRGSCCLVQWLLNLASALSGTAQDSCTGNELPSHVMYFQLRFRDLFDCVINSFGHVPGSFAHVTGSTAKVSDSFGHVIGSFAHVPASAGKVSDSFGHVDGSCAHIPNSAGEVFDSCEHLKHTAGDSLCSGAHSAES